MYKPEQHDAANLIFCHQVGLRAVVRAPFSQHGDIAVS